MLMPAPARARDGILPELATAHADQLVQARRSGFPGSTGSGSPARCDSESRCRPRSENTPCPCSSIPASCWSSSADQRVDFVIGHQSRCEPRGHALERFARDVNVLHHLLRSSVTTRANRRAERARSFDAFEAVDRFAQRPAADAVLQSARSDSTIFAALGELAADDIGLDAVRTYAGQRGGSSFVSLPDCQSRINCKQLS